MTLTSEERLEVAERLRVYSHDFDFGDSDPFWYVAKAAFGNVDVRTYYSVFARLADLIDPTNVAGETTEDIADSTGRSENAVRSAIGRVDAGRHESEDIEI